MDGFERRLHDDLREWTDASTRRSPESWAEEARAVIAEGSPERRPSRPLVAGLAAAAVVVAIAVGLTLSDLPVTEPPSSPIASGPSASAAPSVQPSAGPTPVAPEDLDLSRIAWWDKQTISFGVIPEWTPPPNPPVQPQAYEQVRIGTLDGHVTAMLALNPEHGHSYVSGPVDGTVVVVDDRPIFSSIRLVDAFSGTSQYVHFSLDRITAAALSPTRDVVYYIKVERTSGEDRGVWALPLNGNPEREVTRAPDFAAGDVPTWNLHASPDGATLLAQYCRGEVACTTRIVDLATGHVQDSEAIGWPHRIVGREVFAEAISTTDWVALNLDTLEVRAARERAVGENAIEEFGVELPADWEARWPRVTIDSLEPDEQASPVVLWNVRTRAERTTPPLTVEWPAAGCEPVSPSELPSGQAVGSGIRLMENGSARLRFGVGDNLVDTSAGPLPAPPLRDPRGEVTIRGRQASLGAADPPGVPPTWADRIIDMVDTTYPVIQWQDDSCWYRIELQGLRFSDPRLPSAEEYATRF